MTKFKSELFLSAKNILMKDKIQVRCLTLPKTIKSSPDMSHSVLATTETMDKYTRT
jgi:hypothetical protein